MKKAISLFVVLSVILMSLAGITFTGSASDTTVTIDDVSYETISTAAEFASKIAANPKGNFALIGDFTLDQTLTENPYDSVDIFYGKLIGAAKDASGYEMRTVNIISNSNYGLFKAIEGATFEYINLAGTINAGNNNTGAFAAESSGQSDYTSTFNNCECNVEIGVSLSITSKYVGGFIGYVNSNISMVKCVNSGNIKNTYSTSKPATYVGGLLGFIYDKSGMSVSIEKCANLGNISNKNDSVVAGLIAANPGRVPVTISESFNAGDINSSSGKAGGFVGYFAERNNGGNGTLTITDCYNCGTVSGTTIGAFAGSVVNGDFINCYDVSETETALANGTTLNYKNCYYLAEDDGERVKGVQALSHSSMLNLASYSETVVNDETTTTYSFDPQIWEKHGTYPYIQIIGNYQPVDVTAIETPVAEVSYIEASDSYEIIWNEIADPTLTGYALTIKDSEGTEVITEEIILNSYSVPAELLNGVYSVSLIAKSEYESGDSAACEITLDTRFASFDEPYIIKNARQFKNIEKDNDASYYLAADISLDHTAEENPYIPFEFTGDLTGVDADGKEEIRTVNVTVNGDTAVGMFTSLTGAMIKNIRITGQITDTNSLYIYTGGIAGTASSGTTTFENCINEAEITSQSSYTGGIAGHSGGGTVNFINCKNSGNILSSNMTVGGIAGNIKNTDNTIGCANIGELKATRYVGGIIGSTNSGSTEIIVKKSYNTGSLEATHTSTNNIGGIIGSAYAAEISDCYNAGSFIGTASVPMIGSLIGNIASEKTATLISCYGGAMADIPFTSGDGTVKYTSCYYLSMAEGSELNGLMPLTSSQMKKQSTGTTLNDNFAGFDFANVWTYDEDGVYPYPQLIGNIQEVVIEAIATPSLNEVVSDANDVYNVSWNAITDNTLSGYELIVTDLEGTEIYNELLSSDVTSYDLSKGLTMGEAYNVSLIAKSRFDGGDSEALEFSFDTIFAGGEGTEQAPYLIKNERQFNNIALRATAKTVYFKLMEDITLGDKANDISFVPFEFCGVFLGNNKTVTLYINDPETTDIGLFGNVLTGSIIQDVIVEGEITSTVKSAYIGGIAGKIGAATITNCVNNVVISTDNSFVGGIFGGITGGVKVIGCTNNGDIKTRDATVGGIGGYLNSSTPSIENCENNGDVVGNYVGGIVARDKVGSITGCVNNGDLTGYSYCGGILGSKTDASTSLSIDNCFNSGRIIANDAEEGFVGGIVGQSAGTLSITGCTNLGPVFKLGEYINNPIIASTYAASVSDCTYLAYDNAYDDGIETTTLKTAEQFTNSELDNFVLVEIAENENGSIYYEGEKFYIKSGTELKLIAIADNTDYSNVSADCGNNPVSVEGSTITLTVAENCVVAVTFSIPEFAISEILVYGDEPSEIVNFNELIYFENKFTSVARASQYGAMLFTKFGGVSRSDKEEFGFVYSKDNSLSETDVLIPVSKSTAGVYFYGNNTEETNYVGGYLKLKDGTYIFSEDVYEFRLTTLNKGE